MNKFAIAALIATASAGFSVDGVSLADKTSEETFDAAKVAQRKAYDDAVKDAKNKDNLKGCEAKKYPEDPSWDASEVDGDSDEKKAAGKKANAKLLADW